MAGRRSGSASRYRRVKELFRTLLDTPRSAREKRLSEECADDATLHRSMDALLRTLDRSGALAPDVVTSVLLEATGVGGASSALPVSGGDTGARRFKPHEMLGRYCVVGKIAEGGMGQVWRAVDTSLDREVAIKLLPAYLKDAERLSRFRQEAKIVASLNHPNIVTLYAVEEVEGVQFIVMELVGGKTLRAGIPATGMPLRQVLDYAIPVADALSVAHANGITHRDLKPENVMVTPEGWIKVLDFGLAKRAASNPRSTVLDEDDDWRARDQIVGTPPYMSPEQLRGKATGPQSDVFSLGILLYEMAVGERPFTGETLLDVVASILRDPAPRPSDMRADLPREFDDIVRSCLQTDPPRRPATAQPILDRLRALRRERERAALQTLAPTRGASEPDAQVQHTIAVMPPVDLTRDQEHGYLCTGIAEELATALSRIEGLRVTAVSRIDRDNVSALEMGRMLQADSLLDGSVGREGDRVRVGVRLVDVSNTATLWSQQFDRSALDAFAIQDDVARAVSSALQMRLTPVVRKNRAHDPAAHAAYLKGRFFWGKRYEGGLKRALSCFDEAIARDADMPAAHVGRADCFSILGHYGALDPNIAYAQARAAAERALELQPDSAEAHASLAWITAFYDWSWDEASTRFARALELDPTYATAWHWNGIHLLSRGRPDEAIESLEQAQRADPLSLMISTILGWALHTTNENARALEVLRNVLEMDPRFVFAHTILAKLLATTDEAEAAVDAAERGALTSGREGLSLAVLAYAYARAGRIDEADAVIEEIRAGDRFVSPLHLALGTLGTGRDDEALAHLEDTVHARDSFFSSMYFDPVFDAVRSTPRFAELLRAMNLTHTGGDGASEHP